MKNSQPNQSNKPSETFIFLYQYIIQELFAQICKKYKNYSVKPNFKNEDIHIAIWKKFEEYKRKALLNMCGSRLDRHKLASCICGAIIEIKPLVGFNGAKINKYANEILALQVGLDVIKVYMIRDLCISGKNRNTIIKYMKENFNMNFPTLEFNVCDKHDYATNLRTALYNTYHLCDIKGNECFHYDILAYSKIFYHLELYNRNEFKSTYNKCIKMQ